MPRRYDRPPLSTRRCGCDPHRPHRVGCPQTRGRGPASLPPGALRITYVPHRGAPTDEGIVFTRPLRRDGAALRWERAEAFGYDGEIAEVRDGYYFAEVAG